MAFSESFYDKVNEVAMVHNL